MTNEEIKMLLNSRLEKKAFGDVNARAADMDARDAAIAKKVAIGGGLLGLLGVTATLGGGLLLAKLQVKRVKKQLEDKMKSLKEYKKDEPADSPANRDISMYNKSIYDQKAILEARLAGVPKWLQ